MERNKGGKESGEVKVVIFNRVVKKTPPEKISFGKD